MSAFNALIATKDGGNDHNNVSADLARAASAGRRSGARRLFDTQLQGWPGRHGTTRHHAQVSHGSGDRFGGHCGGIFLGGIQARRFRDRHRIRHGRNHLGRLRAIRQSSGRASGASSCGHVAGAIHGDRHRGLHRDAVRAGTGIPRPETRLGRSAGDRSIRRSGRNRHRDSFQIRASRFCGHRAGPNRSRTYDR